MRGKQHYQVSSYQSFQLFVAGPCQLESAGSTATEGVHIHSPKTEVQYRYEGRCGLTKGVFVFHMKGVGARWCVT